MSKGKESNSEVLDVIEVEDYNTAWRTVQFDSEQWETLRSCWELDSAFRNQLGSAPQVPVSIHFLDPLDPSNEHSPIMLPTEAKWNYLRRSVKHNGPPNWPGG